jgi:hypothetical protein
MLSVETIRTLVHVCACKKDFERLVEEVSFEIVSLSLDFDIFCPFCPIHAGAKNRNSLLDI